MKKLLLIFIIITLSLQLTYSDCKTEIVKKDYGLSSLKSIVLDIGEKIVKKSDSTKLNKLITILGKIDTKNARQVGIIDLFKDYFECKVNIENIVNMDGDYYKIVYNNPENISGKIGLKNQIETAIKNNTKKIDINFYDNYNGDVKAIGSINNCSTINNNWCSTNWNYYKIYIPKQAKISSLLISSSPTRPTGSYIIMYNFIEDGKKGIINFDNIEADNDDANLFNSNKTFKIFMTDAERIDIRNFNILKGGWLYIALSQYSFNCNEDKIYSSCAINRKLSFNAYMAFENTEKMQKFIDNTKFDKNGNPLVYNVEFMNGKICDGNQQQISCDQILKSGN